MRSTLILIVALLILSPESGVQGQDSQPLPPVKTEGIIKQNGIIFTAPVQGVPFGAPAASAAAIRIATDGDGASQMWTFATDGTGMQGGGSMASLLQNKSIRDEIELVDSQYKKIQKFNQDFQRELNAEIQNLLKPSRKGDGKKGNDSVKLSAARIPEMIKKSQKEAEEKLKDLLLPHQIKRLEQVAHRVKLKRSGVARALTTGELKDELDLSDEDVKNLRTRSRELQENLAKEMAKLRKKAEEDLMKELTAKQRRKLKELLGDEFDFKENFFERSLRGLQPAPTLGPPVGTAPVPSIRYSR